MFCEHPKIVTNKYSGERLFVPCGHCRTCLINKQSVVEKRIQNECDIHKFNIFFTLTYSNDKVPCIKVGDNHIFRGVNCSEVLDTTDCVLNDMVVPNLYEKRNQVLTPLSYDTYGVIYYHDIQNFLKKIRNGLQFRFENTSLFKEEWKLRYAICCEYGSQRFRPHYHGIFHFNNEEVAVYALSIICSCWSFCDWEKITIQSPSGLPSFVSSQQGAKYVAKYSTKYDIQFPIAKFKDFSPRVKYSKFPYYGLGTLDRQVIKEIVTGDDFTFEQFFASSSSSNVAVRPSSFIQDFLLRRFQFIDKMPLERLVGYVLGFFKAPSKSVELFVAKVRKNVKTLIGSINSSSIRYYLQRVFQFISQYKNRKLKDEMSKYDSLHKLDYVRLKYQSLSSFYVTKELYQFLRISCVSLLEQFHFTINSCLKFKSLFNELSKFGVLLDDLPFLVTSSPNEFFKSEIFSMIVSHKSYLSLKTF